jgi:hypothetical protein
MQCTNITWPLRDTFQCHVTLKFLRTTRLINMLKFNKNNNNNNSIIIIIISCAISQFCTPSTAELVKWRNCMCTEQRHQIHYCKNYICSQYVLDVMPAVSKISICEKGSEPFYDWTVDFNYPQNSKKTHIFPEENIRNFSENRKNMIC